MSHPRQQSFQTFDQRQDYACVERRLPHWLQSGTLMFVTFRTHDSIPRFVLEQWLAERCRFLRDNGIDPAADDWAQRIDRLPQAICDAYHLRLGERWNNALDECHGACELRDQTAAQIVADSLLHFDGDRYDITDFVVMPNHVHFLVAFRDAEQALAQFEGWKRFTATRINRLFGRKDRFWQQDGFDHLVRSEEAFLHYRGYIAENPKRARLGVGEYLHYSKTL